MGKVAGRPAYAQRRPNGDGPSCIYLFWLMLAESHRCCWVFCRQLPETLTEDGHLGKEARAAAREAGTTGPATTGAASGAGAAAAPCRGDCPHPRKPGAIGVPVACGESQPRALEGLGCR